MKTKTKIEKLLFVVITAFLLFSCEKELYEDSIKKDYNGKTEILIGKEAEKVALRLKNILGSRSTLDNGSLARTITLDIGTINYDEIVKIIDTYGKENYTFEIRYPIEDDKKFGNLILQEKDNYTTVKLIEYYMTDAFAQEYKLNYDLKQFQGNIKFIPIYTDNPCPDPELIVQIGNVPANCIGCGGGSNNNNNGNIPGGGTINPGGNNYSEPLIITITDGDTSQDSGEDNTDVPNWIIWNPPTFGKLSIDPITPTDPTTPEDPCPQTTEIGILYPVDKCSKTFLEHLDNTSRKWLYTHNEVHNDIMNYIKNSPNCDEANEFAKDAIDSFRNGGEVDFIYKIIIDGSLKNNPCLFGVYTQLGKAPTFQNYLQNFDGEFSVANLKLAASSALPSNRNAETSPPSNYLITITFNVNNLNRPSLSIARTFIHEMIHAEIFRKLLSCANLPNLNFSNYTSSEWTNFIVGLKDNYPGLYDYYLRYFFNVPAGQVVSDEQHQLMAQHYRTIIVNTLKQFDNTKPESLYQALAWEGLQNTVAWNLLSPSEKASINTIISNFNSSNSNCQ
ncbi:MAG: hypothetical protein LCH35_04990 [Bacteroidetes bacterium]|nr:hypothetical protein [Bacteroidota bacterium]